MLKITKIAKGILGLALTTAASTAMAQESLRIGDSFPVGHYISENLTKFWMEEVTRMSDGGITFEYFPAQQMGKVKDLLSLTQTGVLDIGYVAPAYVADKMPLSAVGELPEGFSTSCEGTKAYWEIAKPGNILDQAEIAQAGMRLLMVMVLPPYQIYTGDRAIEGLASFEGMKLRATGGAMEITARKLGAVPVQMPAPEVREAISRGTLDAVLFPASSLLPYEIVPHLKEATKGMNFASFVVTYMISQKKWDALSPENQKILSEAGEAATMHGCEIADQLNTTDKKTIADGGVKFVDFSAEDTTKINALLAKVGSEWADGLEAQGKPARKILDAFRNALPK
ncbi:TRAP transporter substrate-binding protein DctP [Pseudooceanicola sp.]|uniref:TRAP transporter substrate-binding protein n=1 Tax=Pseudooceanicola sp. TaxID=1914328 RepID=UPI002626B286|nr:TRAP transporter substrate-binding protein DctP [Pseudooceanicola sp.]MDF1855088.1 TRAP transporter substrate-binding protein DctP [Pseudooceanicola sp.]